MNCRHCQRDMSQCLDGRLPSGRRASVMQHLETCEECSQLWREFQQAQELILRLPVRKVSADFQERLWERIKAGEGTPDAVFNEPTPLITKARYLMTGAAAAALLLVLLNVWDTGSGQTVTDPTRVATVDGQSAIDRTRVAEIALPEPTPLAPVSFTQGAARFVARESRRLDEQYRMLEQLPQGRVHESTVQVILDSAGGVKSVGELLLSLERERHLELREGMADALNDLAAQLDVNALRSARDVQTLRTNLQPVIGQVRRLLFLPGQVMVRVDWSREEQQDFAWQVGQMYLQKRELPRYIQIQIIRRPTTPGPRFRLDQENHDLMYFNVSPTVERR